MSMSTMSPLEAMADELSAATKIITGYCTLEGILQPSFDPEAPSVTIPHAAPRYVREARQRLLSASKKLLQLATEPSEYLPNIAVQVCLVAAMNEVTTNFISTPVPIYLLPQMAWAFSGVCSHSTSRLCSLSSFGQYLLCSRTPIAERCPYDYDQWLSM